MLKASIRDLRTRFPKIRELLEREGEIIITERGQPIMVLQPYQEPAVPAVERFDYRKRLLRRMPRPLSAVSRRALHEADRDER